MRTSFTSIADAPAAPAVAVVVDVMRAFTVAAHAFAGGAEKIVFAATHAEALAFKARNPGWLAFQDGAPVPGFDLANSPAQADALDLRGRTIVQRTTAGTAGALAVAGAGTLLCASFTVAAATAAFLRRLRPEAVTFVVTGDDGRAEEDLACAQYIAALVDSPATDPAPYLDRARHSAAAADLTAGLRRGYTGIHPADIPLCLTPDRFPFTLAAASRAPLTLHPIPDPSAP